MGPNFSALVLVAVASGLFGLLMAIARQDHFLRKAVNPHRMTWLISAVVVVWAGLALMRLEAGDWGPHTWLRLLSALIYDENASPRVKVASLALFFGVLLLGMVGVCVFFYPRGPSTFRGPDGRKAAVEYYVGGLRGGLDFALLATGDGEVLVEEVDGRKVEGWGAHLPKVLPDISVPQAAAVIGGQEVTPQSNPAIPKLRVRTITDQVNFWRRCARTAHERRGELEGLFGVAHQGHFCQVFIDTEYGAMFFRYLRQPDASVAGETGLYLFAATLNQSEVESGRAEQHFKLLLEALQHTDRAVCSA